MKKLLLLLSFIGFINIANATNLDDWSNEDLCRWIDAEIIPEPILLEIEYRDIICQINQAQSNQAQSNQAQSNQAQSNQAQSNQVVSGVEMEKPYISEHGTVFPSPKSLNSNRNHGDVRFRFTYKITL